MAAYEVLLLNTAIPQIQAAQAGDTYVCPRDIQITANLNVTGNTTLGDASTDTVRVNGYMGVGGAPASNIATYIRNSALTGATQHGIVSSPVGSTAGTSEVSSVSGQPGTSASAYTVANVYSFWAFDALKGAGSTITNLHGLYVRDLTQGTNNYGITSLVSSGANKWNIYASGTAQNYFAGNVGIGTSAPNTLLEISTTVDPILRLNNSTNTVTNGADIGEIQFYTNDASTSGTGVKAFVKTVAQAFGANQGGADLVFGTAAYAVGDASEKMRIDKDGNVGIGTSAPDRLLQLSSADTAYLRLENQDSTGTVGQLIGLIEFEGQDSGGSGVRAQIGAVYEGTNGATAVSIGTSADAGSVTERFRVDRNGNLIQTVNTTAATLTTNQTLTFSIVDDSTLRISVRGSDGTTRTATIALT